MKKFLSFFMLAMLAVFTMTSCSKDNDSPVDPDPVPTGQKGFIYGIVVNEVFVNCIKSVEFTYTLPGEATKTETVEFKKLADGNYAVVLEKYTSKTGKFSVQATYTLKDDIDNTEKVDLAFGMVTKYGEKGKISADYQLSEVSGIQPGKLKDIIERTAKLLSTELSGEF